jgi:hypothetical protein
MSNLSISSASALRSDNAGDSSCIFWRGFLVCGAAVYDWVFALGVLEGVLALGIWPYYIGVKVSGLVC